MNPLTMKLVGTLVGLLAIAGLVLGLKHYKGLAADRGEKLAAICEATRAAADEPKLGCGQVVIQIQQLGTSLKATTDALNDQNEKVAELGRKSAEQKREADRALKAAEGRAQKAQEMARKLLNSSVTDHGVECEPSETLQEAWP